MGESVCMVQKEKHLSDWEKWPHSGKFEILCGRSGLTESAFHAIILKLSSYFNRDE